ncbi:hypothetical protein ACSVH2_04140 [Flavobacterium sp. RSB2_4_14]
MKKIFLLLIVLGFLTSCGPKRLGCGPSRCSIDGEKPVLEKKFPKQLNT